MYGKIFESMYDGTIAVNWKALVTFQQLIILCDKEGIIDITPSSLSRRTNIPIDIIEEGLAYLEKPDKYSRSPDHQGRRIVKIDDDREWGWRIVNYYYYRTLASKEDKRIKDAARIAEKRAQKKGNKINNVADSRAESQTVADVAHVNVNTNVNTGTNTPPDPKSIFWQNIVTVFGPSGRSFAGKLIKQYGEDLVIEKLAVTMAKNPADPKSYLIGALKVKSNGKESYLDRIERLNREADAEQGRVVLDDDGRGVPA